MDVVEFAGYMVEHSLLSKSERQVSDYIRDPGETSLIYLYGPSGVGKSTLLGGLMRRLAEEAGPAMAADPAHLPYLFAEAFAPETGSFSWRQLYQDLLANANEQGLDWKKTAERWHARPGATELRTVLVNIVRHRAVRAVIIDEAPHIGIAASGRRVHDQVDVLKGLASAMHVPIVIAGTYRLRDFSDLSDQGSRRAADVHFPRYAPDADGLVDFGEIAEHFLTLLPFSLKPTKRLLSELYDGSLGCVGNLKNWLLRAALRADREGSGRLTRAHLRAGRKSAKQLQTMAKALSDGEERVTADERDLAAVRAALGRVLPVLPVAEPTAAMSAIYRTPPGRRKPGRLPTGSQAPRG